MSRPKSFALAPGAALLIAGMALGPACVADDDGAIGEPGAAPAEAPVGERAEEIYGNPGSGPNDVKREANDTGGRFPEVMRFLYPALVPDGNGVLVTQWFHCTGTVVAPYAVLTANHCFPNTANLGQVIWDGAGVAFDVAAFHRNPYLQERHLPAWWKALNPHPQDWPAQHDQQVLFVPGLTPEVLRQRGLRPLEVSAKGGAPSFTLVGVASTGGASRDFIAQRFVPAVPNMLGDGARDGYLSTDVTTASYGNANSGDSGGPAVGSWLYPWVDGSKLEVGRHIVGTVTNGMKPGFTAGEPLELSPLAYDPGIAMTPNQKFSVRLNSLWAAARADDPDGDGLPTACDPNPAAPNPDADNLCPAPVGGPRGATPAPDGYPVAQLECRPGYVPVGLGGRVGALIDRLAVQCRALSCFGNPGGQCAGNPSYEYWTDGFGGEGGGPWTGSCPDGNVLVGVGATEDAPSGWMYSLAPRCAPFGAVMSGGATPTQLASVGSYWAGAPAKRDCTGGKVLTGFQARSHVDRGELVTGVQPICSADLKGFRSYLGGQGGEESVLRCPNGFRAIGTVQNAQGGAINAFGLLCGPSNLSGATTPDSQIVVAHGGYWHYPGSLPVPAMVEPLVGAHLPPFAAVKRCDGYLLGITTRTDSVVQYIGNLMCSEGSTLTNYAQKPVSVGNPIAGIYRAQSCPFFRSIDALYIRHGWSTDGFSLHCRE